MTLGINYGSGDQQDRIPYVRYNAKAGRFYNVDRIQETDGWSTDETEITLNMVCAFDFGSIETGWMLFAAGQAPSFALAPLGMPVPERPSPKHTMGFRLKLIGKILGGVREITSTAKSIIGSIDALHNQFLAAPEAAAGKIPVVALVRTTELKSQYKDPAGATQTSINYAPEWLIQQWVDRPAALGPRTVPAPMAAATGNGTAPQTRHAPPPAQVVNPVAMAMPATTRAAAPMDIDDEIPF